MATLEAMKKPAGTAAGPLPAAPAPAEAGPYFVAAYPPFDCWSREAAADGQGVLDRPPAPPPPLGVYVHLPFCAERCDYCYYLSGSGRSRREMDRYLDALAAEAAFYARSPALAGRQPEFVYFGGGTPSLLSPEQIGRLTAALKAAFPWSLAREVSFECAPKTATVPRLREMRAAGVTRLSLGVQQLDDEVLARNGRIHRVRDVERAWEAVRREGFEVVNVDLMTGLVGESDESFARSLEGVLALGPECVTLYALEIHPNTPLYRALQAGEPGVEVADCETRRRRLAEGFERLEAAGYTVRSAYAAVRDPARHLFLYQDLQYAGADLLALGASAFGYLDGVHYQNRSSFDAYLESVEAGEPPWGRAYRLDEEERLVREVVLQLKLGRLDLARFQRRFRVDLRRRFRAPLERLQAAGWLSVGDREIVLTRAGLVRADGLLPELYLPRHGGPVSGSGPG